MRRSPADRIVAEYLAKAAAASDGLLPAQREEFLDRLHDEVRDRVGVGPRRDVAAVTSALAELGDPAHLVALERSRLGVAVREMRRRVGAMSLEVPAAELDGLRAAVIRQRSTAELPAQAIDRLLFRTPVPEPPSESPGWRAGLRGMRWEICALMAFAVGPLFVGLLALFVGSAMVARSRFWEVRDKVRALLGIPVAGAFTVLVWAWAEATQLNELESSATRLRAAGESIADSARYAVPILGLLIAARLGFLVVREARWAQTVRRAPGAAR